METLKNKKIVLIEDNEFLAKIILQKLKSLGAEAYHYTNGLEGLAGIRHFKPDLVLLDIMLPVMNGYEVLQIMQKESLTDKYPVLIISNSGQPVELTRIHQLGARDYLVKADFTPDEVLDKARIILQLNPQPVEGRTQKEALIRKQESGQEFVSMPIMSKATAETSDVIKILIVEDDPMLRNMLSMKLSRSSDITYMFVSEGDQAVETVRSFVPDVIVLDLMLPGMDGFEILSVLNNTIDIPRKPVVILTNKSDDSDRERAAELGVAKYLIKAVTDLTELVEILKKLAKG